MRLSTLFALSTFAAACTKAAPLNWGTDKIRGVNIGGWPLVESFITPSIFEKVQDNAVVDEYVWQEIRLGGCCTAPQATLIRCNCQGRLPGVSLTRPGRDQFITEKSFGLIRGADLNTVRMPIGMSKTGL